MVEPQEVKHNRWLIGPEHRLLGPGDGDVALHWGRLGRGAPRSASYVARCDELSIPLTRRRPDAIEGALALVGQCAAV